MIPAAVSAEMELLDFLPRTRVVFGEGALSRLGSYASQLGFRRSLLVADPGLCEAGHVARASKLLQAAGATLSFFHDFGPNPDSAMVEAGRAVAAAASIDSIVALGGGSSLDCAKGINFLVSGGGHMRDYRGYGKAGGRLLPSIGIPTTAGTGSEAQSYAIISDAETHAKMACGDPGAAFAVAILDPALIRTAPPEVAAVAGYDAISHAVESYVTTKGTPISSMLAREAWRLMRSNYLRVLGQVPAAAGGAEVDSRRPELDPDGAMLLGSHLAGMALEASMLGATHACANPLTARYGTAHGIAIAVMLPHVVHWNAELVREKYDDLGSDPGQTGVRPPHRSDSTLWDELRELARTAGLPATLTALGVRRDDLPALAADAATQWTGTFNPRPFDAAAALTLYERAY
jgi:alcohol dehydrogenase